ncbi:hypothetical protein ElyMa_001724800 [Elysia marginata]|uniref:Uncharacterized protein n=1 Tax=Elysia marginata TaxID=1093978 RepID=A0AAV4JV30_9GAST|nr:hypothetical protein ElyMa_001724800 [Elysia marginata]
MGSSGKEQNQQEVIPDNPTIITLTANTDDGKRSRDGILKDVEPVLKVILSDIQQHPTASSSLEGSPVQ